MGREVQVGEDNTGRVHGGARQCEVIVFCEYYNLILIVPRLWSWTTDPGCPTGSPTDSSGGTSKMFSFIFSIWKWRFYVLRGVVGKIRWVKPHKDFSRCLARCKYSLRVTHYHKLVVGTDGGVPQKNLRRLTRTWLWWALYVMHNNLNLILQASGNSCRFWSTETNKG